MKIVTINEKHCISLCDISTLVPLPYNHCHCRVNIGLIEDCLQFQPPSLPPSLKHELKPSSQLRAGSEVEDIIDGASGAGLIEEPKHTLPQFFEHAIITPSKAAVVGTLLSAGREFNLIKL